MNRLIVGKFYKTKKGKEWQHHTRNFLYMKFPFKVECTTEENTHAGRKYGVFVAKDRNGATRSWPIALDWIDFVDSDNYVTKNPVNSP